MLRQQTKPFDAAFRRFFIIVLVLLMLLHPKAEAQGVLQANLSGFDTNGSPITGLAVFLLPIISPGDTNVFHPVAFQVVLNSDRVVFDTGRIFGGSTAWPFGLGSAMYLGDSTQFSGNVGMEEFQINDMLAGVTAFALYDEVAYRDSVDGNIVPVPETSTMILLPLGLALFLAVHKREGYSGRNHLVSDQKS